MIFQCVVVWSDLVWRAFIFLYNFRDRFLNRENGLWRQRPEKTATPSFLGRRWRRVVREPAQNQSTSDLPTVHIETSKVCKAQ